MILEKRQVKVFVLYKTPDAGDTFAETHIPLVNKTPSLRVRLRARSSAAWITVYLSTAGRGAETFQRRGPGDERRGEIRKRGANQFFDAKER